MLLVKTYVDRSTIPGIGLGCFADEDIPAGTKIWELNPFLDQVFNDHSLSLMTDLERKFLETYCFRFNNFYYLCCDNARYFNHSADNPNTYDPSNEFSTYASRYIKKGEEIFSDYRSFGLNEDDLKFNSI